MPANIYMIGCGGVGSYFLPPFLKTLKHCKDRNFRNKPVTLVDGDIIEERNIDRQQFGTCDIGLNKTVALAVEHEDYYEGLGNLPVYVDGSFNPPPRSWFLVFVDNHVARNEILGALDRLGGCAILAANSTIGAQAYFYDSKWKGNPLDPRVRYPEITTDKTGSPVQAAGCASDEALDDAPQTPVANFMAASFAQLLFNFWAFEQKALDPALTQSIWPVEMSNTSTRLNVTTYGQLTTNHTNTHTP